jgi:hypothetical protein
MHTGWAGGLMDACPCPAHAPFGVCHGGQQAGHGRQLTVLVPVSTAAKRHHVAEKNVGDGGREAEQGGKEIHETVRNGG